MKEKELYCNVLDLIKKREDLIDRRDNLEIELEAIPKKITFCECDLSDALKKWSLNVSLSNDELVRLTELLKEPEDTYENQYLVTIKGDKYHRSEPSRGDNCFDCDLKFFCELNRMKGGDNLCVYNENYSFIKKK